MFGSPALAFAGVYSGLSKIPLDMFGIGEATSKLDHVIAVHQVVVLASSGLLTVLLMFLRRHMEPYGSLVSSFGRKAVDIACCLRLSPTGGALRGPAQQSVGGRTGSGASTASGRCSPPGTQSTVDGSAPFNIDIEAGMERRASK